MHVLYYYEPEMWPTKKWDQCDNINWECDQCEFNLRPMWSMWIRITNKLKPNAWYILKTFIELKLDVSSRKHTGSSEYDNSTL